MVPGVPDPRSHEKRGGAGDGTQKVVYHTLPDQIFPLVNFSFSHEVTLWRWRRRPI